MYREKANEESFVPNIYLLGCFESNLSFGNQLKWKLHYPNEPFFKSIITIDEEWLIYNNVHLKKYSSRFLEGLKYI